MSDHSNCNRRTSLDLPGTLTTAVLSRGTMPGGTPTRPILPTAVLIRAPYNLLTGSLPEGLQYTTMFRDALHNTSQPSTSSSRDMVPPQSVFSLAKNTLNGKIPDYFFQAASSPARVDIYLGVRPYFFFSLPTR